MTFLTYQLSLAEWELDLESPTSITVFTVLQREPEDPTAVMIYRAFHIHLVPKITQCGIIIIILIL